MSLVWILLAFGVISFIQNMAFTWSSRSRNSGDPNYHRFASWASNGVYYITNALLTIYIVKYMDKGFLALLLSGLVYTITTAEGSVLMMKWLLKKEKGKRHVGSVSKQDFDDLKKTVEYLSANQVPADQGQWRVADNAIGNTASN